MPKQLNNGQITQALQRAFGFKGRYIPMLDEVIVPVYVIADPSPAAQTKLCAATASLTIDQTNAFVQLFNPPGSGNIVNVTNVVAISDAKIAIDIAFHDTPGVQNLSDIHFRDRRFSGSPSTQIRSETPGVLLGELVAVITVDGALSQTAAWETQAGDPRQPLAVLDEGQGLIVQKRDIVSASLSVNFRFLEIPRSEVNPSGGVP